MSTKNVAMRVYTLGLMALLFTSTLSFGQMISVHITSSADDAEEPQNGSIVNLISGDLKLVNNGSSVGDQTVGLRFSNVLLPKGAKVLNAYIQFTADGSTSEPTNLTIKGEKEAASKAFISEPRNISRRVFTSKSVRWWDVAPWADGEAGTAQRTPDLAGIIREITTQTDWKTGSPFTFVIQGSGKRRAFSYDGDFVSAAVLVIAYQLSDANDGHKDNADALKGIITGSGKFGGGLGSRGVLSTHTPKDNSQDQGVVVVRVCVDRQGNVTEAAFTQAGSTTTSANLKRIAIESAKKWRFQPGEVDRQCGTITYNFRTP